MLELKAALDLKLPSGVAWSPDGSRIAYEITGPSGADVKVLDLAGGRVDTVIAGAPRVGYYPRHGHDLRWSADGERLVYCTGTEYYTMPAGGGDVRLLFSAVLIGDVMTLSPDQTTICVVRDGDLWALPVGGGHPVRLSQGEGYGEPGPLLFPRLMVWPAWSPDSTRIAYLSRTGAGLKVSVVAARDGEELARIAPDQDEWPMQTIGWSPDGGRLAISRLNDRFTRKQLVVADVATGKQVEIRLDTDDRFVSHNDEQSFQEAFSPDGRWLAFVSNRGGWKHVLVAATDGGDVRQVTEGDNDDNLVGWAPDGASLLVLSSRCHPQQHLPYLVPAGGGELTPLASGPGIYHAAQLGRFKQELIKWSPDGTRLVLPHSGPDEPLGLWLAGVGEPHEANRVWTPVGEGGIGPEDIAHMEPVEFRSADGTRVPGLLITPRDIRRDFPHPALTYHYGGWGQQAALGWALGRKSVFFNYLAALGYVVLITDCRGSEGYGEGHAKDLWHEGGGTQTEDLVAGARFLSDLGYVDPDRIAIFGHSYGAYLAVQTMVGHPGVFRAGIAMSGVYDWLKLGGGYGTYNQLRFGAPDPSPDVLRARSPLGRLDRLDGALLVVHGTDDYNAPISQSEDLVKTLIALDKEFEYMAYPGQPHDWISGDVERDFVRRADAFLTRHMEARVG